MNQFSSYVVPIFLVILGELTAGIAQVKGWHDLGTYGGQAFAAGLALLTKEAHNTLTNNAGGTVNIPALPDQGGTPVDPSK